MKDYPDKMTMEQARRFGDDVLNIVSQIPRGKVTTYGDIARTLCAPRSSRAVGYALHVNPKPVEYPCHRVVNRFGRLAPAFAFGGEQVQRSLLESEGVEVSDDFCVDLSIYGFHPSAKE